MDPQLVSQLPQYGLLILAAMAYAWLHKQHRAERGERDADWRSFLDGQRKEFGATIERVVTEFRESVAEERREHLEELRKVADALDLHDRHASDLADGIKKTVQQAVIEAAAQAAAATMKQAHQNGERKTTT